MNKKNSELKFDRETLVSAIRNTRAKLQDMIMYNDFFAKLKFEQTAYLPYKKSNNSPETNFIEFLNQLFTSLTSLMADKYIKDKKRSEWQAEYAIGEKNGRDINWRNSNGKHIIAEVFAATKTSSNNKLKEDIKALCSPKKNDGKVIQRYVFFILAQNEFEKLGNDNPQRVKEIQSMTNYCSKSGCQIAVKSKINGDENIKNWQCKYHHDKNDKNGKNVTIVCFSQKYAQEFLNNMCK